MDQLMIGYGVTNNTANSQTSNFSTSLIPATAAVGAAPKKELTLLEKQQMASKLESEDHHVNTRKDMSNSMSLQSLATTKSNANTMADNLLNKNLSDLNNSHSMQRKIPNSNSNFNMNNSNNNFFDSFLNEKPPNQQLQQQQQQNKNQMGFFGNLALPAPTPNLNPPPARSTLNQMGAPPRLLMPTTSNMQTNNYNNNKKSAMDDLADLFG